VTVASTRCIASLIVMSGPLVKGCMVSFLRRWSKILFPVLWWPTTIGIDDLYRLGIIALIIIVARPWRFVLLLGFPLLLKLVKVLDL
jgi:hypothetical protein